MKHGVSLMDVARAAGVGKATASRALSMDGRADVGAKTRERVRAIAEELGYRPSRTAQALRTGRHQTLSFAIPLLDWAWWAPMLQGAAEEAYKLGYHLLVYPIQPSTSMKVLVDELAELSVDGLIMVTPGDMGDAYTHHGRPDFPLVYIDDVEERPHVTTIRSANQDGGRQVAHHLIDRGRTRPVVVIPAGEAVYASDRLEGFRTVFADAGLQLPDEAVLKSDEMFNPDEAGSSVVKSLLDRGIEFDAVFAVTDYLAASVLRALSQANVEVPRAVSVVGFDDERAALLVGPPLTTVRQPLALMGATAVRLVVAAVEEGTLEPGLHELPVELITRDSS